MLIKSLVIFDFTTSATTQNWYITNDTVMGGISNSVIEVDADGNGVFRGKVSTENNGGFAMVRHVTSVDCEPFSKIVLKVKGDGKAYQLRIKSNQYQRYWYVHKFETTDKWQIITLNLADFYPSFRGYKLNKPNFSANKIEEIAFLIGNKKSEKFELKIDKITLN